MAEKIKKLIASQLGIAESKVSENSKFVEDLGTDSLDMVEMLMTLEEEFHISISDEESLTIKTVGDIIKVVENKQK
ncbi:MAG: acyl carrier protein [Clostridia bacterium]